MVFLHISHPILGQMVHSLVVIGTKWGCHQLIAFLTTEIRETSALRKTLNLGACENGNSLVEHHLTHHGGQSAAVTEELLGTATAARHLRAPRNKSKVLKYFTIHLKMNACLRS